MGQMQEYDAYNDGYWKIIVSFVAMQALFKTLQSVLDVKLCYI